MSAALIGAWQLQRWTARLPEGGSAFPFGDKPNGVLVYTAGGTMCSSYMQSGRAPIGSKVQFRIDAEPAGETVAAENGRFLHRWDKWLPVGEHRAEADVVETDGTVKLKVELGFLRRPQAGDLPPAPATAPAEVTSVEGSPAPCGAGRTRGRDRRSASPPGR